MKKINILVIVPSGFCYGLQHITIKLFSGVSEQVNPFFLITKWSDGEFEKLLNKNFFNYSSSWLGMFSRKFDYHNLKMSFHAILRIPRLYFDFIKLLFKKKPDLLFFANHHEIILLLPLLVVVRINVVCHMHDPPPNIRFQRLTFFFYSKVVNRFVAISEDVKKRLMLLGCNANKITVVLNGIDVLKLSFDTHQSFVERRNSSTENFIVGITGQMTSTKGHEDLIDAFAIAIKIDVNLKLLIGGKPIEPFFTDLKNRISMLDLIGCVEFTGWISEVNDFYNMIDVLVLPSRHDEGYGLVVAEAMSCGKPVIITRSGGATEIVLDGQTGFVVDKRDAKAIAQRIITLKNNQELYNEFSRASVERVNKNFTIGISCQSFLKVIKETI